MALRKFSHQIKWYEYVYMEVFCAVIIILGIVYKSSLLVVFNSLFGVVAVFFIAKGILIGNLLGIVQTVLYAVVSYFNNYYGEMIVCFAVTLPIYFASIISWARNKNKKENVVKVNKNINLNEWVIVLLVLAVVSIGLYFLLKSFNTANLILSTLSMICIMMAGYLIVRRSEYNFVFYILSNIMCLCLWIFIIVKKQDFSYITTVVQFCMFLVLNMFGVYNWIKLKRIQNMRKKIMKKREKMLIIDKDFMEDFR